MDGLEFYQHYWWFIISLLAALLVVFMFVQGGQTLILRIGKDDIERKMILNSLGRKWEITFTTLVVYGGAFFASFSLYYSTSFGGAYWLWMIILFSFIIQAVAYEYMNKPGNFLGRKTYMAFLYINGFIGVYSIGIAVSTLFTGAPFYVNKDNMSDMFMPVISVWGNSAHGLDAYFNLTNILLGLALVFLTRMSGCFYLMNNIDYHEIYLRCRKLAIINSIPFLICFLGFIAFIFVGEGYAVDNINEVIYLEKYKYAINMIQVPFIGIIFVLGVLLVVFSIFRTAYSHTARQTFWYNAAGTLFVVLALFLSLGYNDTAYYPSNIDIQSSLTITNSSSSIFTLKVMSVVSLLIPIVLVYGAVVWRAMDKCKITEAEFKDDNSE